MHVNFRRVFLASAIVAFGGFTAAGAFAATNDPAAVTPSGVPDQKTARATSGVPDARTMQQRVEKRIMELHTSLRVTAAQQPQWDGFVKVMRDNARQMDAAMVTDVNTLAKMTAVEQMQSYAKITDQHAKDVRNLVPAFQSLYDVMSPEQKLNADSYFRAQAQAHPGRSGKKG